VRSSASAYSPSPRRVDVALTDTDCGAIYDDRSALVHGAWVDLSADHVRDAFEQNVVSLQEALRRVVRRAIEERTFAETFAGDASISDRWAVRVRRNGREIAI
jgi:hypothetical protein